MYVNERSWESKKKFLNDIFSKVLELYDPILAEEFVVNWPETADDLKLMVLGISALTKHLLVVRMERYCPPYPKKEYRKNGLSYPPKMAKNLP